MLICYVNELELSDIALLYKNVVILPQDRVANANATRTNSTKEQAITESKKTSDDKATESIEASKPLEPALKKPNDLIIHPFAIITSAALKDQYLEANSSFHKIIQALNIPQVTKHIQLEENVISSNCNYTCIWAIGASTHIEQYLKSLKHENLLISPDLLNLTTNEQKKAMYIPLKNFIDRNVVLLSKI